MNKKGFTLVELLAAIAILGVLVVATVPSVANLIKKSKEEHDKNIIDTAIMATKSYVQDNKKEAPKYIGDSEFIYLDILKEKNYLKEDLKDSAKNSCMGPQSYVKVFKKDTQEYVYTPYIECEGKEIDSEDSGKPAINIFLTDRDGKEVNSEKAKYDMAISKVRVTMFGDKSGNGKKVCDNNVADGYGLVGYSIFIYKYTDIDKNEYVEIYNSGSLRANGKKCIMSEIDLAKYIDVTVENKLKIVVRANNEKGGETTKKFDANFDDKTGPTCEVLSQAKNDEWSNKHERVVRVRCIDEGSGCKKEVYTKIFNKEMGQGIVEIFDNKGNKTECKVNVNLDWTKPTVTIKAYKLKANKENGKNVATATVDGTNSPYDLKKYEDGYGNDSWLNKAKYPYGVHYNITIEDAFTLKEGKWKLNAKNLTKSSDKKKKITELFSNNFTKKNENVAFDIVEEGYRYGEFTVSDKAGNTTKIKIIAPIDRTPPSIPTVSLYKKSSSDNITSKSGASTYTSGSWINKWVFTKASGTTDAISGFDHYEYTVTGASNNATNEKGAYRNINKEGTSYIKYRALDKAGNSSNDSATKTIKLDRTAPTCKNVTKKGNASGGNYKSGNWINENIYTSANCGESGDVSKCTATKKVTTTGTTGQRSKVALANYTVTQEGNSTTRWFVYDNAGNRGDCDEITEKVDKTKPTCSTSKVSDGPNGVKIKVNCKKGDNYSTVNCPTTSTYKASNTFTVTDKAGNSSTCSHTVQQKTQYSRAACSAHAACIKTNTCLAYTNYSGSCECYDEHGVKLNISPYCSASTCTQTCRNALGGQKYYTGVGTCTRSCKTYQYVSGDSCDCTSWGTYSWQDTDCPGGNSTTCNQNGTRIYYY